MTTIHDLLDEYMAMAPDMRTKGLRLDRATRSFLTTDRTWASRFSEVWLWQNRPGRDGKTDTGIDLVAQQRFGGRDALPLRSSSRYEDVASDAESAIVDVDGS